MIVGFKHKTSADKEYAGELHVIGELIVVQLYDLENMYTFLPMGMKYQTAVITESKPAQESKMKLMEVMIPRSAHSVEPGWIDKPKISELIDQWIDGFDDYLQRQLYDLINKHYEFVDQIG